MATKTETREIHPSGDYKLERAMVYVIVVLFILVFVSYAQAQTIDETVTISEVGEGSLLIRTGTDGRYLAAPSVSTDVAIEVSGVVARARVTQKFRNPMVICADAVYVFPLPEKAAIDRLVMTSGDRRIEGVIREKREAAAIYEQARSEGRRASLLDQSRPNVFTTSLANLLPGEEVTVEIEYQQIVRYDNGRFFLRFPTVVAQRYMPPRAAEERTALSPQYRLPAMLVSDGARVNPISIRVEMQPGVPLSSISSPNHRIVASQLDARRHLVTLAEQTIPSDRDFELVWTPQLGSEPTSTAFVERIGDEYFALVTILPPAPASSFVRLPREAIFIIDTSGSMEGASMQQAKSALQLALEKLRPGDTFNIIEFDSSFTKLFPESRPASRDAIDDALRFVEKLSADGGTEMLAALKAALEEQHHVEGTVRQVVFITDGQVGNETELFTTIRNLLGSSRLFTVGIGSAPNSHFMSGAARFGRGTYSYIGDVAEVEEKMTELFDKLDAPVLSDIQVGFDRPASIANAQIRDLYAGEPLVVAAKLDGAPGRVDVKGQIGERTWSSQLALDGAPPASGLAKVWARERIESLTDALSEGVEEETVRAQVLPIALQHSIVSRYTSFVAVDQSPAIANAGRCVVAQVPVNAPHGTPIAGTLPQTATPAGLYILLGVMLTALAVFLRTLY